MTTDERARAIPTATKPAKVNSADYVRLTAGLRQRGLSWDGDAIQAALHAIDNGAEERARLRQRVEKAEAERDTFGEAVLAVCQALDVPNGANVAPEDLVGRIGELRSRVEREARAERDAIAATLERLQREVGELASHVGEWTSTTWATSQNYVYETLRDALCLREAAHKAPATTPPSTVADQNPPVPQDGTDTPQAVQDDPGARERVSVGVGTMQQALDDMAATQKTIAAMTQLPAHYAPRDPKAGGSPVGACGDQLKAVVQGSDSISSTVPPWFTSCHLAHGHTGMHSDGTATWTNREAGS